MNIKEVMETDTENNADVDEVFTLYKTAVKAISFFEEKGEFEIKRFNHPMHPNRFHFYISSKKECSIRTASILIDIDDMLGVRRIEIWGWDTDLNGDFENKRRSWDYIMDCEKTYGGERGEAERIIEDLIVFFNS